MKFRKKLVIVDAVQVTNEWFDGKTANKFKPFGDHIAINTVNRTIEVTTPEGVMKAKIGDWIITNMKGEKYPCKPDVFELTYEPMPE
jgi:hypothetical protein